MYFIENFKDGDKVSGIYYCKSRQSAVSRAGKEYENVILSDKTGSIDTKIWDPNSFAIKEFGASDFVAVSGTVSLYNGKLQFKLDSARIAEEGEYNTSDYMASSRFDIDEMTNEFFEMIGSIKNKYLKELLENIFINDEAFFNIFKKASAAKSVHHGYVGGLLEHSLSVARLTSLICSNYDYANRDLAVTAAMLHDVGKTRELSPFPENDYTDEGNLIGHIVIGYGMLVEKIAEIDGFPAILAQELEHCILSHHGELEYGSPKRPSLVESWILAAADKLDANLEVIREELNGKNSNAWLDYNKLLDCKIRRTEI